MASLYYISVLLIGLVFQPIWCQQCDVVVISQAAIKEEIRAEVTNVLNKVFFDGNVSAFNAERLTERLCDLIDVKLENVTEKIEAKLENVTEKIEAKLENVTEKIEAKLENVTEKIEAKLENVREKIEAKLENVREKIEAKLEKSTEKIISSMKEEIELYHQPGMTPSHPADSCADILHHIPASQSGYYWVKDINGYSHEAYCDMKKSCGGVVGGWMKVVALDMTVTRTQCPGSLRQYNNFNLRTCGIKSDYSMVCSPVILFHTNTTTYSKVCGKIKAYQKGSPDAFGTHVRLVPNSINDNYVDGISLTHGNLRHHIWTFAAALDEDTSSFPQYNCPCTDTRNQNRATSPPAFVGNDYFCDTGSQYRYDKSMFYSRDPLWDGAGCGTYNACCSFNNPPWFYKQLSRATTDDIEMRVCRDETIANEDIRIEMVDIYVH